MQKGDCTCVQAAPPGRDTGGSTATLLASDRQGDAPTASAAAPPLESRLGNGGAASGSGSRIPKWLPTRKK
jgi:hypothetical protein